MWGLLRLATPVWTLLSYPRLVIPHSHHTVSLSCNATWNSFYVLHAGHLTFSTPFQGNPEWSTHQRAVKRHPIHPRVWMTGYGNWLVQLQLFQARHRYRYTRRRRSVQEMRVVRGCRSSGCNITFYGSEDSRRWGRRDMDWGQETLSEG